MSKSIQGDFLANLKPSVRQAVLKVKPGPSGEKTMCKDAESRNDDEESVDEESVDEESIDEESSEKESSDGEEQKECYEGVRMKKEFQLGKRF